MFDYNLTNFYKIFYSPIDWNNSTLVLYVQFVRKKCEGTAGLPAPEHRLSRGNRKNI